MLDKVKSVVLSGDHYLSVLIRLGRLLIDEGLVDGCSFSFSRNGREFLVSESGRVDLPFSFSYDLISDNGVRLGSVSLFSVSDFSDHDRGLFAIIADLLVESVDFEEWEFDFSFVQNRGCRFFPCHEVIDLKDFNCLFCFCPLYFIPDCGGDFSIIEGGIKDCSACRVPHVRSNYEFVVDKLKENL